MCYFKRRGNVRINRFSRNVKAPFGIDVVKKSNTRHCAPAGEKHYFFIFKVDVNIIHDNKYESHNLVLHSTCVEIEKQCHIENLEDVVTNFMD